MATENVKVLRIDTDPAQISVKDLRTELKELKDTMLSCEQGTEEYNKALTRAADIQHTLKDQMEEVNATAMDFGQITSNCIGALGGMVAGFQAATAVMNMFGVENEDVIKTMKTMQQLMSITQALPAIDKGVKAFKRLGIAIKAGTTAMKGFSAAMISTGIGALVVALGLLIANFDKLKAAITGVSEEEKKMQEEEFAKYIQQQNEELDKQIALIKEVAKIKSRGDIVKQLQAEKKALEEVINKEQKRIDDLKEEEQFLINNHNAARLGQVITEYTELERKVEKYNDALKAVNEDLKYQIELQKVRNTVKEDETVDKLKAAYKKLYIEIEDWRKTNTQKEMEAFKKSWQDKIEIIIKMEKAGEITHEEAEKQKLKVTQYYAKKIRDVASVVPSDTLLKGISGFDSLISKGNDELERMSKRLSLSRRDFEVWYKEYFNMRRVGFKGFYEELKLFDDYCNGIKEINAKSIDEMKGVIDLQMTIVRSVGKETLKAIYSEFEAEKQGFDEDLENGIIKLDEYNERITEITNKRDELISENEKKVYSELLDLYEMLDELNEKQYEHIDIMSEGMTKALNGATDILAEISDNPYWGKVTSQLANLSSNFTELYKNIQEGGRKSASSLETVFSVSFAAIGSLLNGLAEEQDTSSREGFEATKNLQAGAALASMMAGIVGAWSSSMELPFPANVIIGAALTAMMAGVGVAQLIKIKSMEYGKTDASLGTAGISSSPSSSAMNSIIAPVQYTNEVNSANIEGAIKNQRVYVTESDISDTQKKVRVSEGEATF